MKALLCGTAALALVSVARGHVGHHAPENQNHLVHENEHVCTGAVDGGLDPNFLRAPQAYNSHIQRRDGVFGGAYTNLRITPVYADISGLSAAEQDVLTNQVMPGAITYLENAMGVIPVNGNLGLPSDSRCQGYYTSGTYAGKCASASNSDVMCRDVAIDESMLAPLEVCSVADGCSMQGGGEGVADTDFVVFVTSVSEPGSTCDPNSSTLAYALSCGLDQNDRPVAGYIRFCPSKFSANDSAINQQIGTAVHELLHALVFSPNLYAFFRDDNGNPRTARDALGYPPYNATGWIADENTIKAFEERGHTVTKIVTPRVVEAVKRHFDCPTLNGAELEDGGSGGSAGAHWEKRQFYEDVMIAVSTPNYYLSIMDLALMEDSGWYKANWSVQETLPWGFHEGCSFATDECISDTGEALDDAHFCTTTTDGCSADYTAKARCNVVNYGSDLPGQFQWFEESTQGGLNQFFDYCPYYWAFSNGDCRNPSNEGANAALYGETYGSNSICLTGTLLDDSYVPVDTASGLCMEHRCLWVDYSVQLEIRPVGGVWKECTPGGSVSFPGYTGSIDCPPANEVCQLWKNDIWNHQNLPAGVVAVEENVNEPAADWTPNGLVTETTSSTTPVEESTTTSETSSATTDPTTTTTTDPTTTTTTDPTTTTTTDPTTTTTTTDPTSTSTTDPTTTTTTDPTTTTTTDPTTTSTTTEDPTTTTPSSTTEDPTSTSTTSTTTEDPTTTSEPTTITSTSETTVTTTVTEDPTTATTTISTTITEDPTTTTTTVSTTVPTTVSTTTTSTTVVTETVTEPFTDSETSPTPLETPPETTATETTVTPEIDFDVNDKIDPDEFGYAAPLREEDDEMVALYITGINRTAFIADETVYRFRLADAISAGTGTAFDGNDVKIRQVNQQLIGIQVSITVRDPQGNVQSASLLVRVLLSVLNLLNDASGLNVRAAEAFNIPNDTFTPVDVREENIQAAAETVLGELPGGPSLLSISYAAQQPVSQEKRRELTSVLALDLNIRDGEGSYQLYRYYVDEEDNGASYTYSGDSEQLWISEAANINNPTGPETDDEEDKGFMGKALSGSFPEVLVPVAIGLALIAVIAAVTIGAIRRRRRGAVTTGKRAGRTSGLGTGAENAEQYDDDMRMSYYHLERAGSTQLDQSVPQGVPRAYYNRSDYGTDCDDEQWDEPIYNRVV
eukprot:Clim_evm89s88 gene=Clim_evmTU89s88